MFKILFICFIDNMFCLKIYFIITNKCNTTYIPYIYIYTHIICMCVCVCVDTKRKPCCY